MEYESVELVLIIVNEMEIFDTNAACVLSTDILPGTICIVINEID